MSNQQAKNSVVSYFRTIILLVLLFMLVWSAWQTLQAFYASYQTQSELTSRITDYQGTATAIAPDGALYDNAALNLVAQFVTNTPEAPDPVATITPEPPPVDANATTIPLPTFFPPAQSDVVEIAGTAVPPPAQVIPREYNLVNIVLLGGDDEITNDNSVRTDTMIIVSVNTDTGSVAMLNLPRDVFVYVPTPTMTRLNTVYGIGEAFGWSGGGFGLLRETIFYNFGIQVHYYARINISGLATIIDQLDGVDIAVDCAYQDYALIGAEVPSMAQGPDEDGLYTLPVGYYHFTGQESLWYARTRGNSDDFDRGRRQQELLRAIFRAGRDSGQIAQIPQLWSELTSIVETDIPFDVVLGLLPIALNLDTVALQSYRLVRTDHTIPWQPSTGAFAGQYVQLLNPQRIFDLFSDFYQPPTQSQLEMSAPTVAVYNGTSNENWDLVASETLRNAGLNAYAAGLAESQDIAQTQLIDYAVLDKGSPVQMIVSQMNILRENITIAPDPERSVDYAIIVGADYNSCQGSVVSIDN